MEYSYNGELLGKADVLDRIKKDWSKIRNIDNPDEELYMDAVTMDGLALQYVPKEYHTPKMERYALQDNWKAIQYVNEKTQKLLDITKEAKMETLVAEHYGISRDNLFVEKNHISGRHLIYYKDKGLKQLLGKADRYGTIQKWSKKVEKFRHMIGLDMPDRESKTTGRGIWTSGIKSAAEMDAYLKNKTDINPEKTTKDLTEKMSKEELAEEIDVLSDALKNQAEEIAIEYQTNINSVTREIAGILGLKENELYFEGNMLTTKDGNYKFILNEKGEIIDKAQNFLKHNIVQNRKKSIENIAMLFGIQNKELYYNKEDNTVQSGKSYIKEHEKKLATGSIYVSLNEHGRIAGEIWKELQSNVLVDPKKITFASLGLMNSDSLDRNEENIVLKMGYDELKRILPFDEKTLQKAKEQNSNFAATDIQEWKKAVHSEEFENLVRKTGVTDFPENMRIDILKRAAKMLLQEKTIERNKEKQTGRKHHFILFDELEPGQKSMVNDVNPSIRKMAAEVGYGLDKLKKDHNPEIQLAVLSHNGYGWEEIVKNARAEEVQKELVRQRPDDPAIASMLFKTDHASVRAEIINRCIDKLPSEVVEKEFNKETDPMVLCAFAKKGYNLNELAKKQDVVVRIAAVEAMAVRGDDVARFAKSPDAEIRTIVAKSGQKLSLLLKDKDENVRNAAEIKYNENIQKSLDTICGKRDINVEMESCGLDQIVCDQNDGIPIAKLDSNGNIEYFVNGFDPDATDEKKIDAQSAEDIEEEHDDH